jgi:hypothetical protein
MLMSDALSADSAGMMHTASPTQILVGQTSLTADILRASTDCCAISTNGRTILTVGRDGIVQLLRMRGRGYAGIAAWRTDDFHGEFAGGADEALAVLAEPYAVITTDSCNLYTPGGSVSAAESDSDLDGYFATLQDAISHITIEYSMPATVALDSVIALGWGADNPNPQTGERKTIIDRAASRGLTAIAGAR